MRFPLSLLTTFLTLIILSGCKPSDQDASKTFSDYRGVKVAATTPVVASLVRQIGGVRVQVDALIPLGTDPDQFQVTSEIRDRLSKVRGVFLTNLPVEDEVINSLKYLQSPPRAFQLGKKIPKEAQIPFPDGTPNLQFFWNDVSLWRLAVDEVLAGLLEIDPDGRTAYEQNAEFYQQNLTQLHEWARRRAQEIPPERRIILTTRNGLAYFGKPYFFATAAVELPAKIDSAAQLIQEKQIHAIFAEEGVPRDIIDQVAAKASVNVAGPLYIYGPGKPGTMETSQGETYDCGTYIGMIKHNVNTAIVALK